MAVAYNKWVTSYYSVRSHGDVRYFYVRGVGSYIGFVEASHGECPTFRDPRNEVTQDLNRLMFVTGAQALTWLSDSEVESRTDSRLPIHTSTVGSLVGHQPVSGSS